MVNVTPTRTLEQTLAWEVARLGQSRLTGGDWSGGVNVNDCALFQSAALGHPRVIWNTEVFKTATGGTYHAGKGGLRRGDIVLFDWNGNGLSEHVEMATGSPDAAGNFQTVGANSSARADHGVAYNIRNAYVLGYFRPKYKTAAAPATPTETAPATPAAVQEAEDMILITHKTLGEHLVGPGYDHHLTPAQSKAVKGYFQKKGATIDFGTDKNGFNAALKAFTSNDKAAAK